MTAPDQPPPQPGETRDHTQDVLRLRRRILALEDRLDRAIRMRGVVVPKSLTAELDKTARWAHEIFVGHGFEMPGVTAGFDLPAAVAGRDTTGGDHA